MEGLQAEEPDFGSEITGFGWLFAEEVGGREAKARERRGREMPP